MNTRPRSTHFERYWKRVNHALAKKLQLDRVDLSILACWDDIHSIFSLRGPTCFGVAHVDKKLPGLSKWRDAAAAACVAFIEQRPDLCSPEATPTIDHPNRRPYQTYKKRRQNLDLHPSKNAIITAAEWDQDRDILRVACGFRWGWEIACSPSTPTSAIRLTRISTGDDRAWG